MSPTQFPCFEGGVREGGVRQRYRRRIRRARPRRATERRLRVASDGGGVASDRARGTRVVGETECGGHRACPRRAHRSRADRRSSRTGLDDDPLAIEEQGEARVDGVGRRGADRAADLLEDCLKLREEAEDEEGIEEVQSQLGVAYARLGDTRKAMEKSAKELDFMMAAKLRDKIKSLQKDLETV